MGHGAYGQWGHRGYGVQEYEQWGTGVWGLSAMGHRGYGVQGVWAMGHRGMGHMGNGAHGRFAPKISKRCQVVKKISSCQKDVKCQKLKHLDYGGGSQKK